MTNQDPLNKTFIHLSNIDSYCFVDDHLFFASVDKIPYGVCTHAISLAPTQPERDSLRGSVNT